jgi:1-acyl-sn-glycerol-3-phosphate acyltransferase
MKRTPLYAFCKTYLQWFIKYFFRYSVNEKERLPKSGRVIVCCNHVSNSDPIRLAFTQHRQIFYMAKAELFQNKALAFLFSSLGAYPVQRGKGDKGAINKAGELLEKDQVLGIFIEGTRSKTGELLQPKSGVVMLAHKYNAPILPCCITAEGGKVPKPFHKCIVSYGELIPPEELGVVEGTGVEFRNASRLVMSKIAELRERDIKVFEHK